MFIYLSLPTFLLYEIQCFGNELCSCRIARRNFDSLLTVVFHCSHTITVTAYTKLYYFIIHFIIINFHLVPIDWSTSYIFIYAKNNQTFGLSLDSKTNYNEYAYYYVCRFKFIYKYSEKIQHSYINNIFKIFLNVLKIFVS